MKKWRSRSAGFPLMFDPAGEIVFGPVDEIGTGVVTVVMGSCAELAGMVTAIVKIEHVNGPVMFKRNHISHPRIIARRREKLE